MLSSEGAGEVTKGSGRENGRMDRTVFHCIFVRASQRMKTQ